MLHFQESPNEEIDLDVSINAGCFFIYFPVRFFKNNSKLYILCLWDFFPGKVPGLVPESRVKLCKENIKKRKLLFISMDYKESIYNAIIKKQEHFRCRVELQLFFFLFS